jgi:hypothetical protein
MRILRWPPRWRSSVDWRRRIPPSKTGLALDPSFAVSRFRTNLVGRCDNPTFLAQLEPVLEDMREAGIPEI